MQNEPILITHYFFPGTDPWKNIMNLPEKEAFRVAAELAEEHPDTTSFGRFADFVNYYPNRKRADEYVREAFIKLGGRPKLLHPYSFVLGECEYLRDWFDTNDKLVLSLSDIPDDQISFTLGDSCALLIHGEEPKVLTKAMLLDEIGACGGSVEEYCKKSLGKYAYVEVQLWYRPCLTTTERLEMRPDAEKKATRSFLADVAKEKAKTPFHGFEEGRESNLGPVIQPFPKWTIEEADGLWCAAFVYYCVREGGFDIPIRPDECKSCHLAGCIAWEEFALGNRQIEYYKGGGDFIPDAGDIVLYDRVFEDREHDHIGIVIEKRENTIIAAEGNVNNRSAIIERPLDEHIRAYIRIPDGFKYQLAENEHG